MDVDNYPPRWALIPPPPPPWELPSPVNCNTLGNNKDCMIVEDYRAPGTLCDAAADAAVDLTNTAFCNRSTFEDGTEIEIGKDCHAPEERHDSADDCIDNGMSKHRKPVYDGAFKIGDSAAACKREQTVAAASGDVIDNQRPGYSSTFDVKDRAGNIEDESTRATSGDVAENQTPDYSRTFDLYDYAGILEEEPFGELYAAYSCPHPNSGCDGFSFSTPEECAEHEQDWHAGPYWCYICGQVFGSAPRLRRHEHYQDSEARRRDLETAEQSRGGEYVRVYHGNASARRRAQKLAKLVERANAAAEKRQGKEVKKMEREIKVVLKKEVARKKNKDGPLVVIGTRDEVKVAEEEKATMLACEEPCCPFFERRFATAANHARHVKSHGHEVAVRMGEALLQQLMRMAASQTATGDAPPLSASTTKQDDVEMSGCGGDQRQNTPPPRPLDAQTQLLSPPPTPHGSPNEDEDEGEWDATEAVPMKLELRLERTRRALRELRCNAPGCWLHGSQMSSSTTYWAHLASPSHVAALRAWSGNGGETVYVPL